MWQIQKSTFLYCGASFKTRERQLFYNIITLKSLFLRLYLDSCHDIIFSILPSPNSAQPWVMNELCHMLLQLTPKPNIITHILLLGWTYNRPPLPLFQQGAPQWVVQQSGPAPWWHPLWLFYCRWPRRRLPEPGDNMQKRVFVNIKQHCVKLGSRALEFMLCAQFRVRFKIF